MDAKKRRVSTLTIPVDTSILPAVRAYVGEIARGAGLSQKDSDGVALAASEACSNVIEHAFLPGEEATFDIACEVTPLNLKVIVKDKGLPFSPDRVERFSIDSVMDGDEPKGLGLFLMEKNVDKLSFNNRGFEGKEVCLVKYFHKKGLKDALKESEQKAYRESLFTAQEPVAVIPYRIGLMEPSQAIEISQCAYRTYGYNYISEFIYYPERIAEMNQRGELISAVAVTDAKREVMSHAALELDDDAEVMELGVAFTKPEFRQQGCLNALTEYLVDRARDKGIKGLYARAVTTHTYSQKAIIRNGFRDCGVFLGLAPRTLFQKVTGDSRHRESIIMFFRGVDKIPAPKLYAPARHKEMLKRIYKNIGVAARWAPPKKSGRRTGRQSVISTRVNNTLLNAKIRVRKYGKNAIDDIKHSLRELCKEKIETISLYLDLRDPLTALYVDDFERMGFIFSGVLPTNSSQYLILQYLNNLIIDYDKIRIESAFSKELLAYIRAYDKI
jgi:serine/threonine-protein kinase RsbW